MTVHVLGHRNRIKPHNPGDKDKGKKGVLGTFVESLSRLFSGATHEKPLKDVETEPPYKMEPSMEPSKVDISKVYISPVSLKIQRSMRTSIHLN